MKYLLPLLALLALTGCGKARDQAIADSAATMWEAAEAQLRGADLKMTAHAIQCQASAICAAVGCTYPPQPPEMKP